MILSCAGMRALEEAAFANGTSAEDLMEKAGAAIAREVQRIRQTPGLCYAVFGKGNNGGDALVAARHLAAAGWKVLIVPAYAAEAWGELTQRKHAQAFGCVTGSVDALHGSHRGPVVVLDGLLGIGAKGRLRPELARCTRAINQLRAETDATTFALDLPTGLDGDSGEADPDAVLADVTLAIGFAKTGHVADGAANYVGRLRVLRLEALTKEAASFPRSDAVIDEAHLRGALPRRRFDTHKGDYGRVGIIAGSPGMLGAAALCAHACVAAGAGLVTLYATEDIAGQLSQIAIPEVMVRSVPRIEAVPFEKHDALAIGPGLGLRAVEEIRAIIKSAPRPLVVDADALNALAIDTDLLRSAAAPRILTPHPGEMARLFPVAVSRAETARNFTNRYAHAVLLLKGARTVVADATGRLSYNSTGTPGMATGGMGDVLTGVIAAFLGQGIEPRTAAELGAWICGKAGELAVDSEFESEETLTPSVLLRSFGAAFKVLRGADY